MVARRGSRRAAGFAVGSFAAALGLAVSSASSPARADEPVAASEPRMMSETAEVTSVVDAFDKDDPFDLNLTLGFQQSWKHANIRRETTLNQPGLSSGNFTAQTENIASYSQQISTLDIGADVGIYRDLALILRLPIILQDAQSLSDLDGSSSSKANNGRFQDSQGQNIFKLPFSSPTRSGIDWFSVGLDWAIFNQQRDLTKPTWVIGIEGRFGVGTPLHACNANATPQCPDPSQGKAGVEPSAASRSPGISRAMDTVGAHTVFSRRFGYIEPYTGLSFLADFPQSSSDFGATNGFAGNLVNHPPLVGTFTLGTEVIPWERREQFQRLVFDFRALGTYHSEGRDYTELFDALGSTTSGILRSPNPGGYIGGATTGTSVADNSQQKVFFTGITDQLQYASFGGRFSATWQAGEYVKFVAGIGITYNQSHVITADQACNPGASSTIATAGPCFTQSSFGQKTSTGIPNPNYRPTLDVPGNRFLSDDATIVDLWLNGVVMF
jgi:hypothetical protein